VRISAPSILWFRIRDFVYLRRFAVELHGYLHPQLLHSSLLNDYIA